MDPLLKKYLDNTISDDELEQFNKWLNLSENQEAFKQAIDIYKNLDTNRAFQKIRVATIDAKTKSSIPIYKRLYRYAAIAVLLLVIASIMHLVFNYKIKSTKDNIQTAYNEITVPNGKRQNIYLPDSSLIVLNAGTKLKYRRNFNDLNNRDVFLEGEAYFVVTHNKQKPFIVHTNKMNIRVLGTKFNVSNYNNENNISVVLEEGKVEVFNQLNKSIVITPGEKATIKGDNIMVRKVDVEKDLLWKEGKLCFVNEPFVLILKELERHYNITIQNKYLALNNVNFTGTFTSEESIEEVLDAFKETQNDFTFAINGSLGVIDRVSE